MVQMRFKALSSPPKNGNIDQSSRYIGIQLTEVPQGNDV